MTLFSYQKDPINGHSLNLYLKKKKQQKYLSEMEVAFGCGVSEFY